MLKDITLGQYIPGKSVFHKADPRTKIIISCIFMVMLFVTDSFVCLSLSALVVVLSLVLAHIPFGFVIKGVRPILFIASLSAIFNIFSGIGENVLFSWWIFTITAEGILSAVRIIVRIVLLVIGTSLLTYTTTPIELTDGIELLFKPLKKIHVPVHDMAMMMTIAIRFIPTLLDEADKIMKAQISRGADLENGNLIQRVKNYVPILLPLFISSFRRADELANAMESRCYRGDIGRTKMKHLRYGENDIRLATFTGIYVAVLIVLFYIIGI